MWATGLTVAAHVRTRHRSAYGCMFTVHALQLHVPAAPSLCHSVPYSPGFPPAVKSNDMMHVIYIASLIRSILALHKLIDNKEQRLWTEKDAAKRDKEKADKEAKEKAEKEAKEKGEGKEGKEDKGKEAAGK